MKKYTLLLILITFLSCKAQDNPVQFSSEALADVLVDTNGNDVTFATILKKYEGKQVLIDVWASWCKDCITGMPAVKGLQANNPETVFVFLSLDKTQNSWKNGIEKHQIKGEHYYLKSGWKGDFATFLDLDWIPRYLIIDKTGKITLFKATKATDKKIKTHL